MAKQTEVDPLEAALKAQEREEHPLLSAAEIEGARAEARKRVQAKQKKEALDKIIEEETRLLTASTGDGYKDELIWVNIDLPEFADRLIIDGRIYLHNHMYHLPRHMVNSMREQMSRMWEHYADTKGESMANKIAKYRMANYDELPGTHVSA